MSPAEFLGTAQSMGVTLWDESGVLRYRGPREAVEKVAPVLKAHKVAILKALGTPIYKDLPGVSPEFAARLSDEDLGALSQADRPPIVLRSSSDRPQNEPETTQNPAFGAVVVPPTNALSGVSSEFAARLSTEDLEDIAAGDIPVEQVVAFEAAAIAREAEDLMVILQHDAGLDRPEAEIETARLAMAYARNRGFLWASLRVALSGYPELLAQVPDRIGKVDGPALGLATVAVLKNKRVVRQGEFSGAWEVTP